MHKRVPALISRSAPEKRFIRRWKRGTGRRWKRNGIRPPGIIHAQIDCTRALGNSEHGIVHSVRSALFRARTIIYGRSSEAREHIQAVRLTRTRGSTIMPRGHNSGTDVPRQGKIRPGIVRIRSDRASSVGVSTSALVASLAILLQLWWPIISFHVHVGINAV